MSNNSRPCCFYCDETKFTNRAEAQASLKNGSSKRVNSVTSMCHHLGPVTRNAFFNFMRHLRETTCSRSIIDMAKHAGQEWRKMSDMEKCPYVMEAHRAPKRARRRQLRLKNSSLSLGSSTMRNSTMMAHGPPRKATKRLKPNMSSTLNATRLNRSRKANSIGNLNGFHNISAIKKSPR